MSEHKDDHFVEHTAIDGDEFDLFVLPHPGEQDPNVRYATQITLNKGWIRVWSDGSIQVHHRDVMTTMEETTLKKVVNLLKKKRQRSD